MSIDSKEETSLHQVVNEEVIQNLSNPVKSHYSDSLISLFVIVAIFLTVLATAKLHKRLIKMLEFIVSVAWYKRLTVLCIGALSTYISAQVPQAFLSIVIVIGYATTFAFNEFSSKKDIEKSKQPLEVEIKGKNNEIELFRRIIEEKKNTFNSIVIMRVNSCLRVKGKDDSELLRKIKQKVEELQDIILAEKTFLETPDEALRRYNNSTSGDAELASQTMVEETPIMASSAN